MADKKPPEDLDGVHAFNNLKNPYELTLKWLVEDILIAECLTLIDAMTLERINSVYEEVTDRLLETDAPHIERTNN